MGTSLTDQECEEAIKAFAEIADVDEALAHSILQDVDFNVNEALAKFFHENNPDETGELKRESIVELKSEKTSIEIIDLTGAPLHRELEKTYPPAKRLKIDNGIMVGASTSTSISTKVEESSVELPDDFTIFTWNIDGLDTGNLQKRFTAVLQIIGRVNPEVIFFQEMVDDLMPLLIQVMEKMYEIIISDFRAPYYCATLVSRNIRIVKKENIPFSTTTMGRSMLVVEAQWKDLNLKLINTHLESMKPHASARKTQFQRCMRKLRDFTTGPDADRTLGIFGGDLNIRDDEVSPLPKHIKDAWVAAGANANHQFTWDGSRNTNINFRRNIRLRFDRLYFSGPYQKLDFQLHGTQLICGISRFPSDHYGISCRFRM